MVGCRAQSAKLHPTPGASALESEPGYQARALAFLESVLASLLILVLVIVSVTLPIPPSGALVMLALFAIEVGVRAWAMGLSLYFMDPFCALDVTLVTVDIVGERGSAGVRGVSDS